MAEQADFSAPPNTDPLPPTTPTHVRRRQRLRMMASPYERDDAERAGTSRSLSYDEIALLLTYMPESFRHLYKDVPPNWLSYCFSARREREQRLASELVLLCRNTSSLNEPDLICPSCDMMPVIPVTGPCGHTRCYKCVQRSDKCPCDKSHAWRLNLNIIVQETLEKLLATDIELRHWIHTPDERVRELFMPPLDSFFEGNLDFKRGVEERAATSPDQQQPGAAAAASSNSDAIIDMKKQIPITHKMRLTYACHLIELGQLLKAAPHLAIVAATTSKVSSTAHCILIKTLSELIKSWKLKELKDALVEAVNSRAPKRWLSLGDFKCVICCDTLSNPVTTPCGHTFCRQCIERSMDYRPTCALCMQVLQKFDPTIIGQTEIVQSCLVAMDLVPETPPDPSLVPILTSSVSFPGLPSPLFLFKPRYMYLIRRVMGSTSRRFGVVPAETGEYADIGTIMELREGIRLPDGCTIVSAIGISRFRVLERDINEGWCDVARVEPLVDDPIPCGEMVRTMRDLAKLISYKTALWIKCFRPDMRQNIQRLFGPMPKIDINGNWWNQPDGPVWLWWIICTLPIPTETKNLLLSTTDLDQRMRLVVRHLNLAYIFSEQCVEDYESALMEWWQMRQL